MAPAAVDPTAAQLHLLCEHLLAPLRHDRCGRIGLFANEQAISTGDLGDGSSVAITREGLVLEGSHAEVLALDDTTLGALVAATGRMGGANHGIYHLTWPGDLSTPIDLDPAQLSAALDFYGQVAAAIEQLAAVAGYEEISDPVLWPEHFDLAAVDRSINSGGCFGDASEDGPYLYVGPHTPPPLGAADGRFNRSYGACALYAELDGTAGILAFFEDRCAAARALEA